MIGKEPKMEEMRLQKYLAKAGIASRRKSEELIKAGRVAVNGRAASEAGIKVQEKDVVELDGKKICIEEKKVYIMLNKPIGYITTVRDQFARPTVIDLVSGISERIYPVGRLDYDTSGILILTNDGDFTNKLSHPRHETEKVYQVEIRGTMTKEEMQTFRKGVEIDGYRTAPAKIRLLRKNKETSVLQVVIHEGKNRQIRKMFNHFHHPVVNLKRISIGGLKLGSLEEGSWRHLTESELEDLNS